MQGVIWLALGYNLPANPSKNRVYIWRKLKEIGAGSFRPGVAILPKDSQNMSRFRALASKIRELGGDASVIEMRFVDARDEAETIQWFRSQSDTEYAELMKDCSNLMDNIKQNIFPDMERSERVKQVIRRYGKVRARDYFETSSPSALNAALSELAGDIGNLDVKLRAMLEL